MEGAGPNVRVLGSEDDDQISFGSFGVPRPDVRPASRARAERLTVDGRGGDDIVSASTAAVALTLIGGSGDNVLLGGPGDDVLIGGAGFDDVKGGKGDDVAFLRGDFDRFTWAPGDGSDRVDGGACRDSLSSGHQRRRDVCARAAARAGSPATSGVRDLDDLEEIDAVAGGGADTFAIGDLSRTGAALVDVSLAPCRSRPRRRPAPTA